MLSFSSRPGPLGPRPQSSPGTWKSRFQAEDPVARFTREHPGTLCIGRVLCHGETFHGLELSILLVSPEALVLLDTDGKEAVSIPRERIHGVECLPATRSACRDRQPLQGEEHVFVRFEDEQGRESHLEISMGALDDIGPVRQLCDCLRERIGEAEAHN